MKLLSMMMVLALCGPIASPAAAQSGASPLRSFIVGRWAPNAAACARATEFRADGAAISRPGAPPDRWRLEREGDHDVLVIQSGGRIAARPAVSREGARLRFAEQGSPPILLTRC